MDRDYWDKLAGSFSDEVIELAKEDLNGVLLEELDRMASKKRRVVDLGCGAGALLPQLAERFREVVGVDFSKALLRQAEAMYGQEGMSFSQADLTKPVAPAKLFDVTVCSSVLILASRKKCRRILESVVRFTRRRGRVLITVPSLESCIHSYHTLVRLRGELGEGNGYSRKQARRSFANDVSSVLDGHVSIQGVPTKHWMREELLQSVSDAGLRVDRVRRVEFAWETEIDSPPEWLGAPYPWDWLIAATRI